ncbi:diguanylate cyclase [Oceanobacter mangrovi]|uniref:diguanylate cyclase n=1 Tax=Oceanobacter mangrovi TaxID=2862510 RepID=UPI001C8E3546|nr:diguanylate cyclase [Oceanobacter mangrovi]
MISRKLELLAHPERSTVLVVDDDLLNRSIMVDSLQPHYQVIEAESGEQALLLLHRHKPDLVLLDIVMEGISGVEVCRQIKEDPDEEIATIPVLFVTALDDSRQEQLCWEAGGADFIAKPVNVITLQYRVKAHVTLKRQSDVLRRLANLDGLTGLYNRRYFDEQLQRSVRDQANNQQHWSLIMLDVDHFKNYNDRHGHVIGDECLKEVARLMMSSVRRSQDMVARLGGEEFAILLSGTRLDGAERVARSLLNTIRNTAQLSVDNGKGNELNYPFVTVSMGITEILGNGDLAEEDFLKQADEALYQAKGAGRNRICRYAQGLIEEVGDEPV